MSLVSFNSRESQRKQVFQDLGYMGTEVDFDVEEVQATYQTHNHLGETFNKVIPNRKVLLNGDTKQYISTVGHKYSNPLSHAKQFEKIEENIIKSKLDLDGMTREINVSDGGGRAFVNYKFPAHTIDVGGTGDVSLEILGRNSFDGTWPTIFEGGAWRYKCTNLCVFGTTVAVSKQRHTKNINYDRGALQVMNCLEAFLDESEKWSQWIDTEVTDKQAFQALATLSRNNHAIGEIDDINSGYKSIAETLDEATKNKDGQSRVNSPLNTLWNTYVHEYRPTLGSNLWALYNTMTDWTTHNINSRKGTDIHHLRSTKMDDVRKLVIHNPVFKLAA